ncbi:MAG TPA: helicase-related protein [Bacillota bacterium]|nr:helicase-related protein [Bacillota bacterium]HOH10211.1 helicase-related protein [Bacillota bacterium]HOY88692.1 helicase-related protein [Bacillota bacterium]HPI01173.1 helicase-related protein [Bacillota bacterium]HPM63574.1 helicase-related protein [Bacillota bacterium]
MLNTASEVMAVFFFIYHIEKGPYGGTGVGMSPCPEYDLLMALEDGLATMHVISPPMKLAQAFRALKDVKEQADKDLKRSFGRVARSVAIYGAGAKMPSSPVRVHAVSQPPKEEVEKVARLLETRIKGRILRFAELRALLEPSGPSMVAMAAQRLILRSGMLVMPGIAYRGYGGRVCSRCGATAGFVMTDCSSCGSSCCLICGECAAMGSVSECEPLYAMPAAPGKKEADRRHEPVLRYELTSAQKRASGKIRDWYLEGKGDEALVWAVCGAGKTEVSFAAMAEALNRGEKVLYAAPRRDVVAEIGERIQSAFPQASCSSYYSGSTARSNRLTNITVATTHQALRFYRCFDLTVLDEVDAFPYQGSRMLEHAVRRARYETGKTIFMSATPSKQLMDDSKKGLILTARISARHHGHPLPVPEVAAIGPLSSGMISNDKVVPPSGLMDAVKESLVEGHKHFVFVPRKAAAEAVSKTILGALEKEAEHNPVVGWSHSSDPDRERKRRAFTAGGMDVLVCTSIMERGVTVPGCDVTVLGADKDSVFDYRSLVQMAGRAGRQKARPTGRVTFVCEKPNADIKQAIEIITEMNDDALKNGFLVKEGLEDGDC